MSRASAVPATDSVLRRSPGMAVLVQGLPLALGFASHALINLVDLAMVGRLGADAVRAAHVGSSWNFLPMIVGQCVSTALLARLSLLLGAGDAVAARTYHARAQWFMVWLGLLVSVSSTLPAAWMVDGTGLTGAVRDDAVHYLVVGNLGCLPMFVLMQTTAAMRAAGEAWVPLSLLLLANVLNLLLAACLLYGWPALGVSPIGVVGAAYAAVAGRTVAAGLGVLWLRRRRHALSWRQLAPGNLTAVGAQLLGDSWPQAVQIGLRASMFLLLTAIVQHRFGDSATAALGITTRLDTLLLFSSLGFGNAATTYAARACSAARFLPRSAGLWAGAQAGAFASVFVVLVNAWATPLAEVFVLAPDAELVAVTVLYCATGVWSQVLGAVSFAAMGAVQGAGQMRAPMVVDLLGFPVALACLGAAVAADASLRTVFVALVAGMAGVASLHLWHVARGDWASSATLP